MHVRIDIPICHIVHVCGRYHEGDFAHNTRHKCSVGYALEDTVIATDHLSHIADEFQIIYAKFL